MTVSELRALLARVPHNWDAFAIVVEVRDELREVTNFELVPTERDGKPTRAVRMNAKGDSAHRHVETEPEPVAESVDVLPDHG